MARSAFRIYREASLVTRTVIYLFKGLVGSNVILWHWIRILPKMLPQILSKVRSTFLSKRDPISYPWISQTRPSWFARNSSKQDPYFVTLVMILAYLDPCLIMKGVTLYSQGFKHKT